MIKHQVNPTRFLGLITVAALFLPLSAECQTFGIYANLNWYQATGEVDVYAETWGDYTILYYNGLLLNTLVSVQYPSAGPFYYCSIGASATGSNAIISCAFHIDSYCSNPATVTLNTSHGVASLTYLGFGWSDPLGVSLIPSGYPASSGAAWTAPGYYVTAANQQLFSTSTQTQQYSSTCNLPPTGEDSYYMGWGLGGYSLAGSFSMHISGLGDYTNKTVQENWSNFSDLCYFAGSAYVPLTPLSGDSSLWTATSTNWYGLGQPYYPPYDNIGMRDDQASWIRWL